MNNPFGRQAKDQLQQTYAMTFQIRRRGPSIWITWNEGPEVCEVERTIRTMKEFDGQGIKYIYAQRAMNNGTTQCSTTRCYFLTVCEMGIPFYA